MRPFAFRVFWRQCLPGLSLLRPADGLSFRTEASGSLSRGLRSVATFSLSICEAPGCASAGNSGEPYLSPMLLLIRADTDLSASNSRVAKNVDIAVDGGAACTAVVISIAAQGTATCAESG